MIWSCGCRLWTHLQVGRLLYWKTSEVKEAFLRDDKLMPSDFLLANISIEVVQVAGWSPKSEKLLCLKFNAIHLMKQKLNGTETCTILYGIDFLIWRTYSLHFFASFGSAVILGQTSTKKNGNGKCRPLDTKSNEGLHQFSDELWNCSSISCSEKTK